MKCHAVAFCVTPHQHFRAPCHSTLMQWCLPVCALAVTLILMVLVSLVLLLLQLVEVCRCKLHNHMYNAECGHDQVAAPVPAEDDSVYKWVKKQHDYMTTEMNTNLGLSLFRCIYAGSRDLGAFKTLEPSDTISEPRRLESTLEYLQHTNQLNSKKHKSYI